MSSMQSTNDRLSALKRFGKAVCGLPDKIINGIESGLSRVEQVLDPIVVSALKERPLTKSERVLEQIFFNTRNDYVTLDPQGKPILKEEPGLKDFATKEGRAKWKRFNNEPE